MSKTRRPALKLLVCPECGHFGTLRKILYGMPDPESFDFEKFAVGGCCINGDGSDPDVQCRACDWSGFMVNCSAPQYVKAQIRIFVGKDRYCFSHE